MARRLKAEAVYARRQVHVVVDRLGYVHDVDPTLGVIVERDRGEGRVVAADGEQLRDVQPKQAQHRRLQQLRIGGRIGAGDPEIRAAAEVDPADAVDGERDDMDDVTLHQPGEPVLNAQHLHAAEAPANRGGASH